MLYKRKELNRYNRKGINTERTQRLKIIWRTKKNEITNDIKIEFRDLVIKHFIGTTNKEISFLEQCSESSKVNN